MILLGVQLATDDRPINIEVFWRLSLTVVDPITMPTMPTPHNPNMDSYRLI